MRPSILTLQLPGYPLGCRVCVGLRTAIMAYFDTSLRGVSLPRLLE
jgi:hypothetical protein